MKHILPSKVTEAVKKAVIDAAYFLPYDVIKAVKKAASEEKNKRGKNVLYKIVENYKTSKKGEYPLCQDTGITVIFLEVGTDVKIDGDIYAAINEGVKLGYEEGFLRKSVADPITRKNTGTNTPCIIHTRLINGNNVKITVMPKGAGSENKSAVKMLNPSDGEQGIMDFVIETVKKAGASACPPFIIGVGIGGNMETAALLAKHALTRDLEKHSPDPSVARLENKLLKILNKTGVGPLGFGGDTTALKVSIETFPCHIASLPVAVNINCHSSRHKTVML